jgi:hypothetical protein
MSQTANIVSEGEMISVLAEQESRERVGLRMYLENDIVKF